VCALLGVCLLGQRMTGIQYQRLAIGFCLADLAREM
jgi:hypothetical protein